MAAREYLIQELRTLEGKQTWTREDHKRAGVIALQLRQCFCRNCQKKYDNAKSRADYKGYCSMKCQHKKARECGYRPGKESEYVILQRAGLIGNVPVLL